MPQPYYFMVSFWGSRFRSYFLDYCLPSLLSPNNIPALATGNHKFLIATTAEDWAATWTHPSFQRLMRYVDPIFIAMELPALGVNGCAHVQTVWPQMAEMAFQAGSIGVLVIPDAMISDGALLFAQDQIAQGKKAVMAPSVRCDEAKLFANFVRDGALDRLTTSGISARTIMRAQLASFHPEMTRYEWSGDDFAHLPCAVWWRVPESDAVLMHATGWMPLVTDYSRIDRHDVRCLQVSNIDGSYTFDNFGADLDDFAVVTDSDQMAWVGWTPADVGVPIAAHRASSLVKGRILRRFIGSPSSADMLRRKLLQIPVCWHSGDVDAVAWTQTERRARRVLGFYLAGITGAPRLSAFLPILFACEAAVRTVTAASHLGPLILHQIGHSHRIAVTLGLILIGDPMAKARASRLAGIFGRQVIAAIRGRL